MQDFLTDRRHLWQTLRLVGACALAYTFAAMLALKEGYWSLITAIVVTQPMLVDTLSAGRDRVAGTLIGALAGFGVLVLVSTGGPNCRCSGRRSCRWHSSSPCGPIFVCPP